MRTNRELKEFFSNPVFYIIAGVFLALSGYKFYSLILSYTDIISSYPDYMFGGEISALMGMNVNTFLFPKLFGFYSYLILAAVPVLNAGIGYDRTLEIDKIELMVNGLTETGLIIRKIITTTLLMLLILSPTILYPMILSVFTDIDYGVIVSSYIGLLILVFAASCVVTPFGIIKMPIAVSIFFNVVILIIVYIYVLEPVFSSFLYGSIKLSLLLFIAIFSSALILFSSKIYESTRIFG
ncbi:MAG: hypothetical protein NTY22_03420 [Proteobacteria bacterium]|nr:hypothetical protein [Pseudomonadota bacterium]